MVICAARRGASSRKAEQIKKRRSMAVKSRVCGSMVKNKNARRENSCREQLDDNGVAGYRKKPSRGFFILDLAATLKRFWVGEYAGVNQTILAAISGIDQPWR